MEKTSINWIDESIYKPEDQYAYNESSGKIGLKDLICTTIRDIDTEDFDSIKSFLTRQMYRIKVETVMQNGNQCYNIIIYERLDEVYNALKASNLFDIKNNKIFRAREQ